MTLAVLIITDGRRDCFQRTLRSFFDNWAEPSQGCPVDQVIVIDDSADPEYWRWLDESYGYFDIVHHMQRKGFGGAIASGWAEIAKGDHTWVFHLEDDFTFNRPIDPIGMKTVLTQHPDVVQMALKRQPWNEYERLAGGFMEQHPEEYTNETTAGHDWCWQRRFFSTNPSLYRTSLIERGWPQEEQSEGKFGLRLLADQPNARFGFWGHTVDEPAVHHIGTERIGTGY